MDVIQNKVTESGIQVVDLESFLPEAKVSAIDLADYMMGGFVLREKEFRSRLKEMDWRQFEGHHVGVFCSTDAIVPTWAFMLVASYLDGIAASVTSSTAETVSERLLLDRIESADWSEFEDRIVVLKGCGSEKVTPSAYIKATAALQKVSRKVMYGEPCSSVPIWRRPKA